MSFWALIDFCVPSVDESQETLIFAWGSSDSFVELGFWVSVQMGFFFLVCLWACKPPISVWMLWEMPMQHILLSLTTCWPWMKKVIRHCWLGLGLISTSSKSNYMSLTLHMGLYHIHKHKHIRRTQASQQQEVFITFVFWAACEQVRGNCVW